MQPSGRLLQFTDAVIAARRWQQRRLGAMGSQLTFDLLAVVVRHSLAGKPATLKELTASLPYSEAGIRKNLRQCVKAGWVLVGTIPHDGRVRVIQARPKLLDAWAEYEALFTTALQARRRE
jgi:DNA-binding MarR family transcriptional regulator